MAPTRFGTDGVRGLANVDLTVELALALGRASARVFKATSFLVGRDTRLSGPLIQAAFSAGVAAEGSDVIDLGVIPTPGVAYFSERTGRPAAVISASHNPFADNGIKLFGPGGVKLDEATEEDIEALLDAILDGPGNDVAPPSGRRVGSLSVETDGAQEYRVHLQAALEGRGLEGLSVVLDCANGAASGFAPEVFSALGAHVATISCAPDGSNINEACGSTDPVRLAQEVTRRRADLGLAFDGDADRLLAVDHLGQVVDGDALLALFAVDLAERNRLRGNAVVVTVMTNLGFRMAMAHRGIEVIETPVGDRHVLAALDQRDLALGGEQSGHIVFRQLATTGDGTLTALALADLVCRRQAPLAELAAGLVERVPQVLVNVPVADPRRLGGATEVWEMVAEIERQLGDEGRVLLRPSGTEPLVRVMVEARSAELATELAGRLSAAVEQALGPGAA